MEPDPYACQWCGQGEVVPSLVVEHEARCVARPERVEAA